MKRIRNIMLVICLLVTALSSTALAYENGSENVNSVEVSEKLIEICKNFFETSNGMYRAVNKMGEDITEEFYNRYKAVYDKQEYEVIGEAIADELNYIRWMDNEESIVENSMARTSVLSKTVKQEFYKLGRTNKLFNGKKTFDMVFSIAGTFRYIDSTGAIQSYNTPVFNLEYFGAGAAFSYQLENVSTNASKKASNRVDFSASYYIKISGYSDGVYLGYETVGPYSGTVSGYGEVV